MSGYENDLSTAAAFSGESSHSGILSAANLRAGSGSSASRQNSTRNSFTRASMSLLRNFQNTFSMAHFSSSNANNSLSIKNPSQNSTTIASGIWNSVRSKVLPIFNGDSLGAPVEELNVWIAEYIETRDGHLNGVIDDIHELISYGLFGMKLSLNLPTVPSDILSVSPVPNYQNSIPNTTFSSSSSSDLKLLSRFVEIWIFTLGTLLPSLQSVFLPVQREISKEILKSKQVANNTKGNSGGGAKERYPHRKSSNVSDISINSRHSTNSSSSNSNSNNSNNATEQQTQPQPKSSLTSFSSSSDSAKSLAATGTLVYIPSEHLSIRNLTLIIFKHFIVLPAAVTLFKIVQKYVDSENSHPLPAIGRIYQMLCIVQSVPCKSLADDMHRYLAKRIIKQQQLEEKSKPSGVSPIEGEMWQHAQSLGSTPSMIPRSHTEDSMAAFMASIKGEKEPSKDEALNCNIYGNITTPFSPCDKDDELLDEILHLIRVKINANGQNSVFGSNASVN